MAGYGSSPLCILRTGLDEILMCVTKIRNIQLLKLTTTSGICTKFNIIVFVLNLDLGALQPPLPLGAPLKYGELLPS